MGADLFGSFAESTCAALVVSGNGFVVFTSEYKGLAHVGDLLYPLVASAAGILCCVLVSWYGVYINKVEKESQIEISLKN